MQIYSTATPSVSIVHHTWFLCDTDINSYPLNDVIRAINAGYEEAISEIINADGFWQWDDTNHTDLPRGKGTLVEGQEQYSFATDYLQIEAVEILDSANRYVRIKPLDHHELLHGQSPQEYFGVDASGNPNTGFPDYFDQVGDSLFLYPAPTATSVTLTNGIRVWFKRTADLFTIADTTQSPGLPSTHHSLLAYMAALPYCMKNHQDRVGLYEKKKEEMMKSLLDHYARREKSRVARAIPEPIVFE